MTVDGLAYTGNGLAKPDDGIGLPDDGPPEAHRRASLAR
jgi:hypothetical protein